MDKLYIVHVWKDGKKEKEKDKDKWCGGGPLLPSMRVALAKFPHQIVDLEVRDHICLPCPNYSWLLGWVLAHAEFFPLLPRHAAAFMGGSCQGTVL